MARKGFDNDLAGQLALGKQLVDKYPDSPRAWLALAGAQIGLNKNAEGRASIAKALELSPKLYVAHATMGNDYIFGEPHDFTKALAHMQEAEALAPDESNAHLLVGDAYRALRNLEKARDEYLRGHELEPRNAVLLVRAGHANTFLGDYAAARADYDSAMAVGRANEKAAYAPFRAYVSVYAGDPAAAIGELNRLVASGDGLGVPDPKANQVAAIANVVSISTPTLNRAPAAGQSAGPVHQGSARRRHGGRRRRRAGQEAVPGDRRLQLQCPRFRTHQERRAAKSRRGDLTAEGRTADGVAQLDLGRQGQQRLLPERLADDLQAHRQAVGIEPARHRCDRKTGETQHERGRDP